MVPALHHPHKPPSPHPPVPPGQNSRLLLLWIIVSWWRWWPCAATPRFFWLLPPRPPPLQPQTHRRDGRTDPQGTDSEFGKKKGTFPTWNAFRFPGKNCERSPANSTRFSQPLRSLATADARREARKEKGKKKPTTLSSLCVHAPLQQRLCKPSDLFSIPQFTSSVLGYRDCIDKSQYLDRSPLIFYEYAPPLLLPQPHPPPSLSISSRSLSFIFFVELTRNDLDDEEYIEIYMFCRGAVRFFF